MTTAHRPTWKAAVGQANEGGWGAGGSVSHQASSLDMPGHTKLKVRHSQAVQDSVAALQAAEQAAQSSRKELLAHRPMDPENEKRAKLKLLQQTKDIDVAKLKAKYDDSDIDDGSSESDLDNDDDSDLDDDSSDDDSGDEEAALQAELAKIRAEREEAKRKAAEEEENEKEEAAAVMGNPLLHVASASSGRSMKRRWNDDVVFRNQAKSEVQQPKKRFINDTVRNDFHKRFLNKFIR